jgi:serine phosphatase RsbU (regulator of sigma subunit)
VRIAAVNVRATDRRAAAAGAAVLLVVVAVYPSVADELGRPLAFFVLPGLLTAVLGGWRPTVAIGLASLVVATIVGIAGPLGPAALAARLLLISLGVAMGAAGAAVREGQRERLDELGEAMALREAFQRALAPAPHPPPGVVAIAAYRPAERWLAVGGDFLEAIAMPDGRMAVLMGDVCGHGPREAAFGAALRAGWKGLALSLAPDPQQWVAALDEAFFRDGRVDTFVTLCTGYLDLGSGQALLLSAGHPPPISMPRGCGARPLALRAHKPLGVGPAVARIPTEVAWAGEPLLFYSDGLVENPMKEGSPRRWDLDGLLGWLDRRPTDDPRSLVDELVLAATAGRQLRDDVAVLLVGGAPTP